MSDSKYCDTCKWWVELGEKVAKSLVDGAGRGHCHAFPPIRNNWLRNEEGLNVWSEFPYTSKNDWCGEWRPKGDL
jgi:hypothetical protein